MRAGEVLIFGDATSLEEAAAHEVVRTVRNAVARRGSCAFVLSGGSTPRGLYERLGEEPYRLGVDWSKLHLFFGDERCVPPDHPESNYRMVKEALLSRIPSLEKSTHRIRGELDPEVAASLYEKEIRRTVSEALPRFDLILLGMGADGHVASLFPNKEALMEPKRWVLPTVGPRPPRNRVTLTLRVINEARKVMFLVAGEEKALTLQRVLQEGDESASMSWPASLVQLKKGRLLWFVDQAAASRLENKLVN